MQTESIGSATPAFAVATLVRVAGEIDISSAPEFRRLLTDASNGNSNNLIVSLENCRYFDSTGLAVLIGVRKSIGDRLRIISPKGTACRRIFEITRLDDVLHVVASLSEAFERP